MKDIFLIWMFIAASFFGCGIDNNQKGRKPMRNINLNEPVLEKWLAGALSVPDDKFIPIDAYQKLLFRPLQESKGAMGLFLKEVVDPYRGVEGVRWKAHAAEPGGIDLLKSEYNAAGLHLVIRESRNLVIVGIARLNENLAESKNKRDYIAGLIQAAMKTDAIDHHWEFQLPMDLNTLWHQRLISNMGAPLIKDLVSRHERSDILLLNDSVYFIFYKKVDQLENFLPDDEWFSREARDALKASQRKS